MYEVDSVVAPSLEDSLESSDSGVRRACLHVLAMAHWRRDPEGAGRVALPGPPCFQSSRASLRQAKDGGPGTLTFLIPYDS